MSAPSAPSRLLLVGWALVAVLGVLVLAVSHDAAGVVHVTVGLVMGLWVALRPGVAAHAVSLALGLLLLLVQVGYVAAGLTDDGPTGILVSDLEGLLAALVVVVAAGSALLRRRRAHGAQTAA